MTPFIQFLKKIIYFLKYALIIIATATVCYFLIALFFSYLPTHPPEHKCHEKNRIYLNTNGVHVDFIVPAEHINQTLLNQLQPLPGTQFVAFGWGDRNFYIETPEWSDLTLPVAFNALFMKSESAMHVTFYKWQPDTWISLDLCDQQLKALIVYIESTFLKDNSGKLLKMDFEGYNDNDRFYDAKGSFTLFNTCNVWVNRGLKSVEVKTAVWTPFDFGVLHHIN